MSIDKEKLKYCLTFALVGALAFGIAFGLEYKILLKLLGYIDLATKYYKLQFVYLGVGYFLGAFILAYLYNLDRMKMMSFAILGALGFVFGAYVLYDIVVPTAGTVVLSIVNISSLAEYGIPFVCGGLISGVTMSTLFLNKRKILIIAIAGLIGFGIAGMVAHSFSFTEGEPYDCKVQDNFKLCKIPVQIDYVLMGAITGIIGGGTLGFTLGYLKFQDIKNYEKTKNA